MYSLLNSISQFFSSPFIELLHQTKQLPVLAAFMLGIVGALAPCQLTGNISAITYYGSRTLDTKKHWIEAFFFILGKIAAFSGLGLSVWLIGHEFQTVITHFFEIFRKLMGPFIMFLGLFLIGIFKLHWLNRIFSLIPIRTMEGVWGSFIMGISFSIAFCPTMFVLFFLTLMPIVLASSYGVVLPTIFAIGTSLPLLVILAIIWFLGMDGLLMKKSKKIGSIVQKTAGILLFMIGILDTITYW